MTTSGSLQLIPSKTLQPWQFANPTRAAFRHVNNNSVIDLKESDNSRRSQSTQQEAASNIRFKWTSRNNRKGRHALLIKPHDAASSAYEVPPYSDTSREVCKGIWRMASRYPFWDISWLVAYIFAWGSLLWLINAFFNFIPLLHPQIQQDRLVLYGAGISAFIGATLFEVGSVFLLLEAFNADQSGCFGWAIDQVLDDNEKAHRLTRAVPDKHSCQHHHFNKRNLVGGPQVQQQPESWTWWPTSDRFRRHYLRDIGFVASAIQIVGATIFWISGFTALPGIYDKLSAEGMTGAYWAPQIAGGAFFIISGALFMIETQKRWWLPEPKVLGWHIGLWNMIGGIGFTLCAIFGIDTSVHWTQYQAACSTFWGSWAFMIASLLQWYESLNKHPVERA